MRLSNKVNNKIFTGLLRVNITLVVVAVVGHSLARTVSKWSSFFCCFYKYLNILFLVSFSRDFFWTETKNFLSKFHRHRVYLHTRAKWSGLYCGNQLTLCMNELERITLPHQYLFFARNSIKPFLLEVFLDR